MMTRKKRLAEATRRIIKLLPCLSRSHKTCSNVVQTVPSLQYHHESLKNQNQLAGHHKYLGRVNGKATASFS
ncbi:hypothetical protein PsorP6_003205 [Peronosclerospora sorghi]|uniref:Uncharacterized protein n=1 Tax=Peronosclerospora sorghi TaxID=230839 RepID=A0ACC0VPT8_9STRA|nr:hypothetical protein PsorP6_003205 [Peronosclerospora sorghi]